MNDKPYEHSIDTARIHALEKSQAELQKSQAHLETLVETLIHSMSGLQQDIKTIVNNQYNRNRPPWNIITGVIVIVLTLVSMAGALLSFTFNMQTNHESDMRKQTNIAQDIELGHLRDDIKFVREWMLERTDDRFTGRDSELLEARLKDLIDRETRDD